jgi:hypothetical protein
VPRPFFDPTAAAAAGRFSLSEPPGSRSATVARYVRKLSRWTRPCFSRGNIDASIDPAAA